MKFKNIFFISFLLLTILTISTVTASENINNDTPNIIENEEINKELNVNFEDNDLITQNNIEDNDFENDEVIDSYDKGEFITKNQDNLLREQNNEVLSANLDGISIELWGDYGYYEYTGKGYDIWVWTNGLTFDNSANYHMNLQIVDKNNKVVYDSTKEMKKSRVYGDMPKFNVNLPGGSYTTISTLKMISSQGSYTSKSFKEEIYLESKAEYEKYLNEDLEDESGEKIKIYAPTVKVKLKAKKYFKATLKYKNGHPIKNEWVTLKIWTGKKAKTYDLKTNSKGIIKFSTKKLKLGTHKVKIDFEDWVTYPGYYGVKYSKIIVKKTIKTAKKTTNKKSSYKTFTLKLKVNSNYYSQKKLKTGDVFLAAANSYARQHPKGIVMGTGIDAGQEGQHSTKLLKAKVWYKNTQTGKTITKTKYATKNKKNIKKFSWINGYKPIKAKVWYKKA